MRPPHKRRAPSTAGPASDVVHGRDAAILARLRKGPAKFAELRATLTGEADASEDQMVRACSNALTRLRLKGVIRQTDDGAWQLAS